MSFKPTLAETIDLSENDDDLKRITYPIYVSPKYDGIRGIGRGGEQVSRTLKPLPNKYVQQAFGHLTHFDGEVIVGDPCDMEDVYNRTQSIVMSKDKECTDLRYYVFDWADESCAHLEYDARLALLRDAVTACGDPRVIVVEYEVANNPEEFLAAEERYLALGFEGIMTRNPKAPYKHGRGAWGNPKKPKDVDQCLMKCKRFEDFEAQITGFVEQLTNTNEATLDELGHTKRSSSKAGMVPANTLGKFIIEWNGKSAEIPCGVIKHSQRKEIWDNQSDYFGQWIKVRHFPFGAKDNLRLPRCVGFRDPIDM